MEEQKQEQTPKNATTKDVLLAVIMALLLPLFWLKEAGERWAIIVFAIIPIVGLLYWLRIPSKQRVKAEKQAELELNNSKLGRVWKYFLWLLLTFAGIVWTSPEFKDTKLG